MDKDLQKSLKGPDQFQVATLRVIKAVQDHRNLVLAIVAPLLLVTLLGFGYQFWAEQQAAKRRETLAGLMAQFEKEEETAEKSSTETKKKVAADHSQSLPKLKSFFDENPKTPEGWLAGLTTAKEFALQKKWTDAENILRVVAQHSSKSKIYQVESRFSLIGVLEEQGRFDDALKESQALLDFVGDELKPTVLLTKGKTLLLKKSTQEAKPVFEEIVSKYASSQEAQKARAYLALEF